MPDTTPRRVARIARPVAIVSAPVAPAVMLAWASGAWSHGWPYLAVMVFILGLAVTLAAAIVWATAVCHMAVAKAFRIGLDVGRAHAPQPPRHARPADLRVVE